MINEPVILLHFDYNYHQVKGLIKSFIDRLLLFGKI